MSVVYVTRIQGFERTTWRMPVERIRAWRLDETTTWSTRCFILLDNGEEWEVDERIGDLEERIVSARKGGA